MAAGSLAVIALGHTLGAMLIPTSRGPAEDTLLAALAAYRFEIMGFNRSHAEFYRGEGFYLSLSLVLFAVLCWQLGTLCAEHPTIVRRLLPLPLAFSFFSTLLCVVYFFAAPLVCSALALLALVLAAIKLRAA